MPNVYENDLRLPELLPKTRCQVRRANGVG